MYCDSNCIWRRFFISYYCRERQNYAIGDTLVITAAGGGSGRTITVTDIDGQGVVLKPTAGKDILCDTTGSLVIPSGTTNQRPITQDRVTGAIRFNTSQLQFEGFNGMTLFLLVVFVTLTKILTY